MCLYCFWLSTCVVLVVVLALVVWYCLGWDKHQERMGSRNIFPCFLGLEFAWLVHRLRWKGLFACREIERRLGKGNSLEQGPVLDIIMGGSGNENSAGSREKKASKYFSQGLVLPFHSLKEEAYVFELFIGWEARTSIFRSAGNRPVLP